MPTSVEQREPPRRGTAHAKLDHRSKCRPARIHHHPAPGTAAVPAVPARHAEPEAHHLPRRRQRVSWLKPRRSGARSGRRGPGPASKGGALPAPRSTVPERRDGRAAAGRGRDRAHQRARVLRPRRRHLRPAFGRAHARVACHRCRRLEEPLAMTADARSTRRSASGVASTRGRARSTWPERTANRFLSSPASSTSTSSAARRGAGCMAPTSGASPPPPRQDPPPLALSRPGPARRRRPRAQRRRP